MNGPHANRFGIIYGALAFVVLLAAFGAWKGVTYKTPKPDPTVAHTSDIRAALGEASLVKVACAFTTASAANQGVKLVSCQKKSVKIAGNQAVVVLTQRDSNRVAYTVQVTLAKGVWTAQGFKVVQ